MNSLLRFLVAFILGIVVYQARLVSDVWAWALLVGSFGAFIFTISSKKSGKILRGASLIFTAFFAGFVHTSVRDVRQQPNHLTHLSLDSLTAYEVVVGSLPEQKKSTFKVEAALRKGQINGQWRDLSAKIILYIDQKATIPQYGDVLLVLGKPQRVASPSNPEQFDYERFLSYQQIYHQHYFRAEDFHIIAHNQGIWYKTWAYGLSQWCDSQLKRLVRWPREYAVTKAMVLGLRDDMDFDLTQAYSAAGAVHVLSVSGFHIAIFIWILSKIFGFLERKRKYGIWLYLAVMLGILWFYAVLTGLSAPVVRAGIMISIVLIAKPLQRKENIEAALWGSALILLLFDPLLIYSVSFQLSYAALAGIIFLEPVISQSLTFGNVLFNKIWEVTAAALAAQAATFPLAVYYFHQFPTYFLLANPAVFALAFLQLPLALLTVAFSWIPYLSEFLGWSTTIVTWLLNQSVVMTEKLPHSTLSRLSFSWVEVVACYAILLLLFQLWQSRDKQWLWAAFLVSVILSVGQLAETYQQSNQRFLVVHDVPKTTAISIVEGRKVTLVADAAFLEDARSQNFVLTNFYAKRGIQQIEKISIEKLDSISFGRLWVNKNTRIVFVEKPIEALSTPFDVAVVRNNAFRNASQITSAFAPTQAVVFDNTNKQYIVKNLREQLPAAENYHFTSENGAWIKAPQH